MVDSHTGGKSHSPSGGAPPPAGGGPPPPTNAAAVTAHGKNYVDGKIVDEATQKPIGNAKFEIVDEDETVVAQGKTNWQGLVHQEVPEPGNYTIRVVEIPPPPGS